MLGSSPATPAVDVTLKKKEEAQGSREVLDEVWVFFLKKNTQSKRSKITQGHSVNGSTPVSNSVSGGFESSCSCNHNMAYSVYW